jgi:hypothetical protein
MSGLVGPVGSTGIGHYLPLLRLMGPASAVAVAAVGAAGALAGQPVAAVGLADDRPGAGGGLAGVAFAVQLDHDVGAQGGVLLVAPDPLKQLGRRPFPGGEGARVEGHKHRVQGGSGWPPGALASSLDARRRTASGLRAGMPRPCR